MNCTYNEKLYEHSFRTIDSHTMGEATRIIYDGFPELPGQTMMEKKEYLHLLLLLLVKMVSKMFLNCN